MAQEFDWVVPLKRIEEQLAPWRVKTGPLLPPVEQGNNKRRKRCKPTLVLEVIGTLVRAKSFDEESGQAMLGFTKRPWLDDFLKLVSERYEVVAFTTSLQALADEVLDWLDPGKCIFSGRLYRQHCTKTMVTTIKHGAEVKEGMEVKDLGRLGRELKRVVLVDHNLLSAAKHMSQGIQVRMFSHGAAADDKDDKELHRVWTVLQRLDTKANLVQELAKMKKEEAEQRETGSGGDEQPSSQEELEAEAVDGVNGQRQEDEGVEKQGKSRKRDRGEVAAADETETVTEETKKPRTEAEKFCVVVVPEEWGSHLNCNQEEQGS